MPIKTQMLAQQIQRLLIEDKDKQRLLEEIEQLPEERKLQLAQLIQEHDQEAMKVLNEKAKEIEQVKERVVDAFPSEETSDEQVREMAHDLKEILKDEQKLAQLIAMSDDFTLSKIEEIIEAGLEHAPEMQQECRQFFQEVRLQKAAFEKEGQQEQKKLLKEVLIARQEQIQNFDKIISKAEKVLGKSYQK